MFYKYLFPFNCISNIFGILRPYDMMMAKPTPITMWLRLWCLMISALFITTFCFSIKITEFSFKNNLELLSDMNDLAINVLIIVLNLFNNEEVCVKMYEHFDTIFKDFNFEENVVRLLVIKMYFWFSLPTIAFGVIAITEIVTQEGPYDIVLSIPIFLSTLDLSMHLYTILALLKVVNHLLAQKLSSCKIKDKNLKTRNPVKYVLSPNVKFVHYKNQNNYDIKLLCEIYDSLSNIIHLLEQKHGFEVLLSIWLMFTSGVVGVTLVAINKENLHWLVLMKTIMPFLMGFIVCIISERLRAQVGQTLTLTIKCLIDYKSVPTMKPSLDTFKQLVSNDQLQFTACSLFNLRYSLLLGTVINVVTYSVIMIQMFLK